MRGGLPNKEPKIQEQWDADNQYQKALDKKQRKRIIHFT